MNSTNFFVVGAQNTIYWEFKKPRRLRQRQRQKAVILLVKRGKNDRAARAGRILVHFSPILVKTTT